MTIAKIRHELKGLIDRAMVPVGRAILRMLPRHPSPEKVVDSIGRFPRLSPYYLLGAMQDREEFIQLVTEVADMRPDLILEIGTAAGGTLFAWAHYARKAVISVDLPCGIHGGGYHKARAPFYRDFGTLGVKPEIYLIPANSQNPETVKSLPPLKVDVLYIDADHREPGVLADYRNYSPLVRPGGLIAFHDIFTHRMFPECGVWPVFQLAAREHGNSRIIYRDGSNIGVGLVYVGGKQ